MRSLLSPVLVAAFFAAPPATGSTTAAATATAQNPRAGVHIQLQDEHGEAVPGVRAEVFSKEERTGISAVSGADGRVFLEMEA